MMKNKLLPFFANADRQSILSDEDRTGIFSFVSTSTTNDRKTARRAGR